MGNPFYEAIRTGAAGWTPEEIEILKARGHWDDITRRRVLNDDYHRATALGIPASTIENIAYVCHEANRAYCRTIGDNSQVDWVTAPAWQKESARKGVLHCLEYPEAGPHASHMNWMAERHRDGWTWGETEDGKAKTHPGMKLWADLPFEQRVKDCLFVDIVRAMDPRKDW